MMYFERYHTKKGQELKLCKNALGWEFTIGGCVKLAGMNL